MLALTSCTTSHIVDTTNDFLPPPDPIGEDGNPVIKYNEETDEVIMPYSYWRKVVTFIIFSYKTPEKEKVDK